eukprot:jgi/Chrzof1/14926/Cz09g21020.t1
MRAREQLLQFFQEEVDHAREAINAGGAAAAEGILGNLILAVDEDANRLLDDEICENLLLLLFAGHDTSSVTLTQALANIQEHPEVMEKLRSEQQAVVAKHGDKFTAHTLKAMVYAEAVIKETLRHRTIVFSVNRRAIREFNLGGYRVPAGSVLFVPLKYLSERDPRWADQSDASMAAVAFNPDRLMTPEGQKQGW